MSCHAHFNDLSQLPSMKLENGEDMERKSTDMSPMLSLVLDKFTEQYYWKKIAHSISTSHLVVIDSSAIGGCVFGPRVGLLENT